MGSYVISDIHGEFDKFQEMLKLINFEDRDTLYILGDIFDRGPEPLKILDYIKAKENIFLLKGNHEQFFIECYEDIINENLGSEIFYCWMRNGGNVTLIKILERGIDYMEELYNYITQLPFIKVIDSYVLVHAGILVPENVEELSFEEIMAMQEEELCLWDRDFVVEDKFIKDKTVIIGHTPTLYFCEKKSEIMHMTGKILIDCGAAYGGKLACLRIEDKKEFYI